MSTSPISRPAPEAGSVTIEALRLHHQVRPLRGEEEGSAIGLLPKGVYGYTYSPGLDEVPVFSKKSYHTFEVHKAADGSEVLIGFVTALQTKELETAQQGAAIQLYPDPWENANCLVAVPLARILAPKRVPPREGGNPFLFTIA